MNKLKASVLLLTLFLSACSTQPEGPVVPVNSYGNVVGGGNEPTQ
jgi:PBP1b-binding outer membrane lipoprotein LpoB